MLTSSQRMLRALAVMSMAIACSSIAIGTAIAPAIAPAAFA